VRCEYSRIQDGYELCCLSDVPATHLVADPDCQALCEGTLLPFDADAAADPWVVLATVSLPDAGVPLTAAEIDERAHRKLLYPTYAVQALARCGCSS
jgi:hypothetical protein